MSVTKKSASPPPMGAHHDLIQQLMDFRTSYLRGLARATVDLEFRKRLTGPDPLRVLEEEFGYVCPWFLQLQLHDSPTRGPRLNAANGVIMTLPYWGESITVYIPEKPKGDARLQMDALAAYYDENPWFLHNKGEGEKVGVPPAAPLPDPPVMYQGKWISVAMDVDRNKRFDLGVTVDDFISFAAAMFNAVALAWEDDAFMAELTAFQGASQESRKRTINHLNEWLGYEYPWQLELIVQKDPTARYDPAAARWVDTTPPVLMLTIPWMTGAMGEDAAERETTANQANPRVAIIGLALYNTDGPGYPFTCG